MYKPRPDPRSATLLINAVPFEEPIRSVPEDSRTRFRKFQRPMRCFPSFAHSGMDTDINSTRAQTWNVTVEQQIGTVWQASVSYLGSYLDRLWGGVHQNPGVFMGLGPCTMNGVSYATCTTDANLNQRRVLYRENPVLGQGLAYVNRISDVGTQSYRALRLSFRRAAASGVTWSGITLSTARRIRKSAAAGCNSRKAM